LFEQADKLRSELESLRQKLLSADEEMASLQSSLDKALASKEEVYRDKQALTEFVNEWTTDEK
jgi:chromosome segregation ATPase